MIGRRGCREGVFRRIGGDCECNTKHFSDGGGDEGNKIGVDDADVCESRKPAVDGEEMGQSVDSGEARTRGVRET